LQSCRPTQREALLLIGASSFSYTAGPQGIFQLGANLRHSLYGFWVIPYVDVTFLKDHIPTGDEKRVASEYAISFGNARLAPARQIH
jgi:hypothetical protein